MQDISYVATVGVTTHGLRTTDLESSIGPEFVEHFIELNGYC